MRISTEKPPNWDKIVKQFGDRWDTGVIVTYGDTAYHHKNGFALDLHTHEETHMRQQRDMGVEEWWHRYFIDPTFRLTQELEAYRNQADYIRDNVMNRVKRQMKIDFIHQSMAEMYDGMISLEEAKRLV